MKKILSILLLMAWRCCLAQTDTNLIATGDWSEPVSDRDGCSLHGRLLVYDKQLTLTYDTGARIYLELQQVPKLDTNGGMWFSDPVEIYYDPNLGIDGQPAELNLELHDGLDQKIPSKGEAFSGVFEKPYWVVLPISATVRIRSTDLTYGSDETNSERLMILDSGSWKIPPHSTNDYYLHGTFTATNDQPSPLHYHIWTGTLKLPTVKISAGLK